MRSSATRASSFRPRASAELSRIWRDERRLVVALATLFLAGALLRGWLLYAYRPGFLGYPDTAYFLIQAETNVFWDKFRVVGYGAFLKAVHAVTDKLTAVAVVQHLLGLATAWLLFLTVRRAGGPRWLGAVPAGALLLGGSQMMIEHAVLSETLFTFLVAVALYAAVRAPSGRALAWAAACGATLGLATTVRLVGMPLIAVGGAWLALALAEQPIRRRLAAGAVAVALGAGVVGGYVVARHSETQQWSLTRTGAYNFYGRVARFADCREFEEPAGSGFLCERRPPDERPGAPFYIFDYRSPSAGHVGNPQFDNPTDRNLDLLSRFSRAAALGQPDEYLLAVARDLWRYVAPGAFEPRGLDQTPRELNDYYFDQMHIGRVLPGIGAYYEGRGGIASKDGSVEAIRAYERVTRFQGPIALGAFLLAALAPFVVTGGPRRVALLLLAVGATLLAVPVLTLFYDYRFALPAVGPIVGAAAIGGWGLWCRLGRARSP